MLICDDSESRVVVFVFTTKINVGTHSHTEFNFVNIIRILFIVCLLESRLLEWSG